MQTAVLLIISRLTQVFSVLLWLYVWIGEGEGKKTWVCACVHLRSDCFLVEMKIYASRTDRQNLLCVFTCESEGENLNASTFWCSYSYSSNPKHKKLFALHSGKETPIYSSIQKLLEQQGQFMCLMYWTLLKGVQQTELVALEHLIKFLVRSKLIMPKSKEISLKLGKKIADAYL